MKYYRPMTIALTALALAVAITLTMSAAAGADQAQQVKKVVEAEQSGDYQKLLVACNEALKSGQLDWAHELYVQQNRAMAYYVQHKFDLSAADFSRIIDKRERVIAYYSLNADEQVYKVLRQMLTAAYLMRSIINEQTGKIQQALDDLEAYFKVGQVNPDKADLERRRNLKKKLGQLK